MLKLKVKFVLCFFHVYMGILLFTLMIHFLLYVFIFDLIRIIWVPNFLTFDIYRIGISKKQHAVCLFGDRGLGG